MKKTIILSAITFFVLIGITSCTKEGVFNPEKKLSKTCYQSDNMDEKKIAEVYTWSGKLLTDIRDRDGYIIQEYEYNNKKQLVKIRFSSDEYIEFSYKNSKLKSATVNFYGKVFAKVDYVHSENKITEATVYVPQNEFNGAPKQDKMTKAFLSLGFSEKMTKKLLSQLANVSLQKTSSSKDDFIRYIIISFEWDEKNISKQIFKYADEIKGKLSWENAEGFRLETSYSYDKKQNPYYGFFGFIGDAYLFEVRTLSYNNITSQKETYFNYDVIDDEYIYNYNYEYEDDFPVKRTHTYFYDNVTSQFHLFYEYR
ncbi:MAG: hypothetical protein LBQ31_01925 [Bacteroidales bacterium]|jgi:hypothetical protein|nr:hypothetical protein [Bacteroidales bacterium]